MSKHQEIALGHYQSHATFSSRHPVYLKASSGSSANIFLSDISPLAHLKICFIIHYSALISVCLWTHFYLLHSKPKGQLKDSAVSSPSSTSFHLFPPPSPSSLPFLPWPSFPCCLSLPHLVTTNLYTIITARCIYLSLYLTCQQLLEWLRDLQAWKVS